MGRTATATIVTMAGLILCSGGALAQQKTLKEQLVGTWNMTSWEQTYPDGHKDKAFGESPKGINTFESNGRFTLIFLNPNLPKVASNDRVRPTAEEAMAIAKGVIAYYGTYTVDEPSKTITLNLEGTSYTNQMGQGQKRIVSSITADELKYQNPTSTSGGKIEVAFRRAK